MFSCIFSDDSLGYEYPFTLKVVQKDGLTCAWCPWHRWAYIKKNTFVYIYPPGGRNYSGKSPTPEGKISIVRWRGLPSQQMIEILPKGVRDFPVLHFLLVFDFISHFYQ
jgi:hypothetical protein